MKRLHQVDSGGLLVPVEDLAIKCCCGKCIKNGMARAFACDTCRKLVPWCAGAADEAPDSCDPCWFNRFGSAAKEARSTGKSIDEVWPQTPEPIERDEERMRTRAIGVAALFGLFVLIVVVIAVHVLSGGKYPRQVDGFHGASRGGLVLPDLHPENAGDRDAAGTARRSEAPQGRIASVALRGARDKAEGVTGRRDVQHLVQVWVAEARWLAYRDHAAMAYVLRRYALEQGVSLTSAAQRLVWPYSRPPAWVRQIGPSCARPAAWPAWLRWEAHRPQCLRLFRRAGAFLRGELRDPCAGRADGWRSPGKALELALRRGYRQIKCGRAVVFVAERSA